MCEADPCIAFGELLMTFDKKIRLIKLKRQNGSGGYTEEASRTIWANVRDIGVTVKYSAVAAGREAEIQVICHRAEYNSDNFTHAEYDGMIYRIESTGASDTKMHIKLILAKGG